MGVVDEHGEALTLLDGLHATGYSHSALERLHQRVQVGPEGVRRGERGERVGHVEAAGERERKRAWTDGRVHFEPRAGELDVYVACAEIGVGVDGEGDDVLELGGESLPVAVVEVYDRRRGLGQWVS